MHLPEKERVDFGIFTKEQAELAISTLRTSYGKQSETEHAVNDTSASVTALTEPPAKKARVVE